MPIPEYISNHIELAIASLAPNFRDKPKLEALLSAIISNNDDVSQDSGIQGLEKNNYDLVYKFLLTQLGPGGECAEGAQLDIWGDILGFPRMGGESDAIYIRELASQFLFITSKGEPETLINIIATYTAATLVELTEYPPASANITFNITPVEPQRLSRRIDNAAQGGVRISLIEVPPSNEFRLDNVAATGESGSIDPLHGLSMVGDATGGLLGRILI
jgi:hypothetical protein